MQWKTGKDLTTSIQKKEDNVEIEKLSQDYKQIKKYKTMIKWKKNIQTSGQEKYQIPRDGRILLTVTRRIKMTSYIFNTEERKTIM